MAAKFYTGVDLCNQELLRAKLQLLSASPTVYAEGMIYYDNSTSNNTAKRPVIRTNDAWKGLAYLSDLESYALATTVSGIDTRLKSVETIFETDTDDAINKWNEVVSFLAGIEGGTLDSILDTFALKTRRVSAGAGLTGGGDLSADRTIALATSGVIAGTYPKVTVDIYGRVTGGSATIAISEVSGLQVHIDNLATIKAWYDAVGKYFKYDSDNEAWYLDGDFYAKGENSAGGPGTETGGSGGGGSDVIFTPSLTSGTKLGELNIDGVTSAIYAPTSLPNPKSLTFGSKTYDGSVARTITASDIGAISDYGGIISALGYTPAKKVVKSITANGSTSQTITHNLNSRDVIVQLFMPSTPYEQVYADVRVTDTNNVTIAFAEAPAYAYKVVIIG